MGDSDLNKALGYAVLAGTSGWSLTQCSDKKFARVGFCLYLANGIVGVIDYVTPHHNENVRKLLNLIARWSRPLYLPLIAAEAFVYAGMEEKWAYCHLIFPGTYLLLTELLKKNVKSDLLDLSTICNTVSVCYSAYTKEDPYGGLCALLNLAAFLGTSYNSMEYFLIIGAANVAAVQFFTQFFG